MIRRSEPFAAAGGDEFIHGIAKGAGYEDEGIEQPPKSIEAACDLEGGGGAGIAEVAVDEEDAAGSGAGKTVAGGEGAAGGGLGGGESEFAGAIVFDNEPHGGIAHDAGSVEDDDKGSMCGEIGASGMGRRIKGPLGHVIHHTRGGWSKGCYRMLRRLFLNRT